MRTAVNSFKVKTSALPECLSLTQKWKLAPHYLICTRYCATTGVAGGRGTSINLSYFIGFQTQWNMLLPPFYRQKGKDSKVWNDLPSSFLHIFAFELLTVPSRLQIKYFLFCEAFSDYPQLSWSFFTGPASYRTICYLLGKVHCVTPTQWVPSSWTLPSILLLQGKGCVRSSG